jgi:hypothetical protein
MPIGEGVLDLTCTPGEDGAPGLTVLSLDPTPMLHTGVNMLRVRLTESDPARTSAVLAGEFEIRETPV